ncbi:hypothetical protein QO179_24420 [Bacillus stercoris]|nr:hypothetical protein [Bacillus stercoris]
MMTINDVQEYRKKNHNTGIYLSAYVYDSQDVKEANLYADFYLDFDAEDDFEKARQDALASVTYLKQKSYNIPEAMIRIYFSGKKGIHLVVPAVAFGVEPDKHLNEYYKVMAQSISEETKNGTLDLKIYDRRRLFRIANSRHADTGLYKIPLTYFELVMMSVDEIKELATMPRAVKYEKGYEITRAKQEYGRNIEKWSNRFGMKFNNSKKFSAKPLDFTPACIQELIDQGPVKGQRNNTAAALTSFWKKQGCTEQKTWDNLVKWNNQSIPEWELKNTMQSVFSNDYEYGCSTLETLATCIGEKCPLFRKTNTKK